MEFLLEKLLSMVWSNVLPTSPNRTGMRIISLGEEKLEREVLGLLGLEGPREDGVCIKGLLKYLSWESKGVPM